jgi:hypothetical protein
MSRPRSWPLAFDVDGGVSFATVVRLGSVNARAIFDLDMDLALPSMSLLFAVQTDD